MRLEGTAALVTGAGTRIGQAIAIGLAQSGCDVAIHYHGSAAGAEETARAVRAAGRRAELLPADLQDAQAARGLAAEAARRLARLDVLVNSAAIMVQERVEDVTPESWNATLDLNLRAMFFVSQGAIPHLRRAKGGGQDREHGGYRGVGAVAQLCAALYQQSGRDHVDEGARARARPRHRGQRDRAGGRAPAGRLGRAVTESHRGDHAVEAPRRSRRRSRRGAVSARGHRLCDRHDPGDRRWETHPLRDVVVVGGGCYGTFYASQLAKAKARGKTDYRTVIVVDRNPDCQAKRELGDSPDRRFVVEDWTSFFDQWLSRAPRTTHDARDDQIVPSPHMPHLMFDWVLRRARQRWPDRAVTVDPVPGSVPTPYDRPGADQTRYVSWADWICPTHCIEPALCPAIGSARTWEMSDTVRALAEQLRAAGRPVRGPALFVCKHQVFGVGMFSADSVRAGDQLVEDAGAKDEAEILVGTISSCHGALNLLTLGPRT